MMLKFIKLVILFSASVFTVAQAESNTLKKVCEESPSEKKFVVNLVKEKRGTQLCTLQSFLELLDHQKSTNECVDDAGLDSSERNFSWSAANLNNDGRFDILMTYFLNSKWGGDSTEFWILANCGDGSYVEIPLGDKQDDRLFYSVMTGGVDKPTGWVQLNAIRLYLRDTNDDTGADPTFDAQEFVLKFDPDAFRYRIVRKGVIKNQPSEEEWKAWHPNRPSASELNVTFGQFPASIPRKFAPSFDCTKASTQTEKTICADGDLSRLDAALTTNYKQIAADSGTNRAQLAADQRAWLKERNTCTTVECLTDAYTRRIDELQRKYPANP